MVRVLIVEDDPRVVEIHRGFVDRIEGFAVVGTAESVDGALTAVEKHRPGLILLDLYLADSSGLDLLRELRARAKGVDVIVVTAAKEAVALREALRGGVVDYILKPYRFERFREALQRYRKYRIQLERGGQVQQEQVDQLLASRPAAHQAAPLEVVPKGIDGLTLRVVLAALEGAESWLTAEEYGTRTGLSRTTARRYLEYLVERGQAQVRAAYGSVGRPERLYSRLNQA